MRNALVTALILFSTQAMAGLPTGFLPNTANGSAKATLTPPPPAVPVRQAVLKFRILKQVIIPQPDGSYLFKSSEVCMSEGKIDVFDMRHDSGSVSSDESFKCAAEYEGRPIELRFGGDKIIYNGPAFPDEPATDMVSAIVAFQGYDGGQPIPEIRSIGTLGGRGAQVPSLYGTLEHGLSWNCANGSCVPSVTEFFTATFEVKD